MHVVFRDSHGLEETETPIDLKQDPADLVVLSFSDSDLGAFEAGWHRAKAAGNPLPSLRLANLVALKHPISVDTYIEQTLCDAKAVLVRLIGGEAYWSYGLMSLQDHARRNDIALAILPADGRPDPRLEELSTVPVSTLHRLNALCDAGGAIAAQAALAQLALSAGLYAKPVPGDKRMPGWGYYDPDQGVLAELPADETPILVSFYRSYLTAADTAPVDALIRQFRAQGFAAYGVFAASLKAPGFGDWLRPSLSAMPPRAIVNATAFSAQNDQGQTPFDGVDCPVFQVALSTARRKDWAEAERGLSPADLAMHVVLPEVDGRLLTGVVSFKAPGKRDPDLQFARFAHRADIALIDRTVEKVINWIKLRHTAPEDRKLAVILSTYPGKTHQMAHAVGLDALASTTAALQGLAENSYSVAHDIDLSNALSTQTQSWQLSEYEAALAALSPDMRADLQAAWGDPATDPDVADGAFQFKSIRAGSALVALQPERGDVQTRDDDYHDLARVPRHAYVAFYLWLRSQGIHALVHMGAHGTLEWLPGKALALSDSCWPEALTGAVPVVYPFIVNDPGEAAQAKRRIGAVTLGHMPPPMTSSAVPEGLVQLERLLDEYSTADGLDPSRRDRLIDNIRDEAFSAGVAEDLFTYKFTT